MNRRLYVYYRVPEADLVITLTAVRAMQAQLVADHVALLAEVLRRPELRDGDVTLMETYAGGVTPALLASINAFAAALPQPRHNEFFYPL